VCGARRAYAGRSALDGIDLVLEPGEIYGLLGPNGAGKTSLVRAISGRLRLDGGTVSIDGRDPARDPLARRLLGLVPQDIALYGDLTARENLEIFARLMGVAAGEAGAAVTEILRKVELNERADDRVDTLSGGMKRRLNIAAGVIHRPRVLLLDEPTVGVDPGARESIHELLTELRGEGLAVLLTTHDLDQAAQLADRVGILIDGRLRDEGTVTDLVDRYFGAGRELIVRLREPPRPADRELLAGQGLTSSDDQLVWTAATESGMADLRRIGDDLAAAGLTIEELRLREPSLRGVFFHLAGREIDA
jgi:ABC-2 type transport system ATP-binding protein